MGDKCFKIRTNATSSFKMICFQKNFFRNGCAFEIKNHESRYEEASKTIHKPFSDERFLNDPKKVNKKRSSDARTATVDIRKSGPSDGR